MANIIIRTSVPNTEGGSAEDIQISYRVEAIDPATGVVLATDHLWLSSKGVGQNAAIAATVTQLAALAWAKQNADRIAEGEAKQLEKVAERAIAKPLLDAIAATPDQVKPRAEIIAVKVVAPVREIG